MMTREQENFRIAQIEEILNQLKSDREMAVINFAIDMEKLSKKYDNDEITMDAFVARTMLANASFMNKIERINKKEKKLTEELLSY